MFYCIYRVLVNGATVMEVIATPTSTLQDPHTTTMTMVTPFMTGIYAFKRIFLKNYNKLLSGPNRENPYMRFKDTDKNLERVVQKPKQ